MAECTRYSIEMDRITGLDTPSAVVDVGRMLYPNADDYFTWWAPWRNMRQRNIGWRLDYVLASQALFDRVRTCSVERETGTSDHAPVIADFDI